MKTTEQAPSGVMQRARQLLRHDAGPGIQCIKYGIAGGMATLTQIVVFYTLGWTVLPHLTDDDLFVRVMRSLFGISPFALATEGRALNAALATGIGFVISNAVAYILNVLFVFKAGRHHWLLEIGYFYAVSGVSVVLGTSLQTLLIARYGITTTQAFGASIATALMINYAMRRFFIFKG